MKRKSFFSAALASVCLASVPVFAQPDSTQIRAPSADELQRMPVHVQANVGMSDYTGNIGALTQLGPLYGVTVGAEGWNILGVEAGYEGTVNSLTGDLDGSLVRHNVSGLLTAGPSIPIRDTDLRPYVGAGLGFTYVNPTDQAEADGLRTDFLTEFPLSAGLNYRIGAITAGVRGTYRVLAADEFAEPTPAEDNPSGGILSGQLSIGGNF